MPKSLTIAYITARKEPEFHWFFQSLINQKRGRQHNLIIVDFYCPKFERNGPIIHTEPKPTVWQGKSRKTKADWWAASNARNTAICLCETDWIAMLDDRCVLMPNWLDAVERAMAGNYAVCGPYEKRHNMTVENGVIKNGGIITGEDSRLKYVKDYYTDPKHHMTNPYPAHPGWWFGCSTATPLEWALNVNGYPEDADGMGSEDYLFGHLLHNNGYPMKYDTEMMIVEDRTPERLGTEMKRTDKGVSPNDKSHAILKRYESQRQSQHPFNLRTIHNAVLNCQPFPEPTWPVTDWYDGQPVCEMT